MNWIFAIKFLMQNSLIFFIVKWNSNNCYFIRLCIHNVSRTGINKIWFLILPLLITVIISRHITKICTFFCSILSNLIQIFELCCKISNNVHISYNFHCNYMNMHGVITVIGIDDINIVLLASMKNSILALSVIMCILSVNEPFFEIFSVH